MTDCVFCDIVQKRLPYFSIYEDNTHLAFLDIEPNVEGMTLVIPKRHLCSDIFSLDKQEYLDLMTASMVVARKIEIALPVQRVAMACEGLGIDHAHMKLYPLHGLERKFEERWSNERVFFPTYEGYITTKLGPRMDNERLEQIANRIRQGVTD